MILATTKERLLHYLEYKQINKTEFYKITSMKRGLIDGDKLAASVTDASLAKILEHFPDLNVEWLITGKGDMLRSASVLYSTNNRTQSTVSDKKDSYVTAGKVVALYCPEEGTVASLINDKRGIATMWLNIPDLPSCDGAIKISTESMAPALRKGDVAIYKAINKLSSPLKWGEMYIVVYEKDRQEIVSLNYVQKAESGQSLILSGQNPKYAPKQVSIEKIKALALVKAYIRYAK